MEPPQGEKRRSEKERKKEREEEREKEGLPFSVRKSRLS
jgi:hypothetical protein